ncbi:DNRLRE domain-containing protein [Scytonema tolypothrichoides VB-61278]|nr:DNRLRE domain-containing protein [Scytonema tolypothrichoides VB-61278]
MERVDAAWDPDKVTWDSRPPSTPAGVSRAVGPGAGFYVEWEIGPLLAEWRDLRRPRPNFGLALRGPAGASLGLSLASAESAKPPRLVVSYTPVIAIDLGVALEWEPGADDKLGPELAPGCPSPAAGLPAGYRANLERGLREAARYLYSMSEGQITLGEVTIGSDPKAWQEADVRVLASSGYRPSAYVGGIVAAPRLAATPGGQPVLHYPAPVFLGRLWDGAGARCGGWAEPEGWRTIGHELAHFALFLYDQYANLRDSALTIPVLGLEFRVNSSP